MIKGINGPHGVEPVHVAEARNYVFQTMERNIFPRFLSDALEKGMFDQIRTRVPQEILFQSFAGQPEGQWIFKKFSSNDS